MMASPTQEPTTKGRLAGTQITAQKNHLWDLRLACHLAAQGKRRRLVRQIKFSVMGQGLGHPSSVPRRAGHLSQSQHDRPYCRHW
jgi:hypothetical protein